MNEKIKKWWKRINTMGDDDFFPALPLLERFFLGIGVVICGILFVTLIITIFNYYK